MMNKEMKREVKMIPFESGELLGIRLEDGNIYLGVKKACLDIGLSEKQAERQVANIQSDLVLKSNYLKFEVVQIEGNRQVKREVVGINEDVVTLWLAKIALTPEMQRNNPEVVNKLINYQLKAAKVLHEAFMGTEESKAEFYNEMGLTGQIVHLETKVEELTNEFVETKGKLETLIDSSTINSRQAKKLLTTAQERVRELLGGRAHSKRYKENSRMYFKNLWVSLCKEMGASEYREINPLKFNESIEYIKNWIYVEHDSVVMD